MDVLLGKSHPSGTDERGFPGFKPHGTSLVKVILPETNKTSMVRMVYHPNVQWEFQCLNIPDQLVLLMEDIRRSPVEVGSLSHFLGFF